MRRKILFIIVFLLICKICFGDSTERELTIEGIPNEGFKIEVIEKGGMIYFKVWWKGIQEIPINEDESRAIYVLKPPDVWEKVETTDTVFVLPKFTAAYLEIGDGDKVVSKSPLGFGINRTAFFSFGLAREYMEYSTFSLIMGAGKNIPSYDKWWFNLGKMYEGLKE